jgi:HD-like signal output (HDOD) protein
MAGILHDVGKLIQTDVPGLHRLLSMNTKIPEIQMEYHYLGASHAEIGAYMLSLWGLPSGVIKAVAFHHNPAKETSYRVDAVSAVNIANCLYYSENPQAGKRNIQILLDKPYLERINAEKMLDEWKDMARRVFKGERP